MCLGVYRYLGDKRWHTVRPQARRAFLKNYQNYSGDSRITKRYFMRQMIETHLAEELTALPKAWIVPFGSTALLALEYLAGRGRMGADRILGGILHPGGQQ